MTPPPAWVRFRRTAASRHAHGVQAGGGVTADQDADDRRSSLGTGSQHRAGFVGLVGRPNVGKSSLLNAALKRKVSIVSPRPQTTRHRILGILTQPDAQVVFVDSPGWHKPLHPFGKHLVEIAKGVFDEVDVLVAVIEATSEITREDEWVFEEVARAKRPAILAINKVDLVKKPMILPLLEQCARLNLFQEQIPVSAKTGQNMDALLTQLIARLPEGPRLYEADRVTDQTTEQIVREFIREAVLSATHQEVPHAVAVRLEEMISEDRPASRVQPGQYARLTRIRATILVEREGQKAIVIGKQGQMLKGIGITCRMELERWLGQQVFLELWVKVAKEWRTDSAILRELGYQP